MVSPTAAHEPEPRLFHDGASLAPGRKDRPRLAVLRGRWRWGLFALGVLGISALAGTRGTKVRVVPVESRALVQKVVATGRVEPPARVSLGTLAAGIAKAVHAEEGERVAAGQLLVELDAAEAEAAVEQAKAGVAAARARLEALRQTSSRVASEGLRQAEIGLASAAQNLERLEALARAGAGSQQSLDDARRAVELATSQRESALAQLAATSRSGSDVLLASANLAQAEAALLAARARLAQTRVVAPAAGVILSRAVEPGDVVQPGRTLLLLARDGETRLVAEPDEKSLAFVRPGQRARASADAFPALAFDARVEIIAPAVDPQRGTVEIKLQVPEPPEYLRADMTVSVDIEVARLARALVVPAEVVRDAAGERPWVLLLNDGRAERRPVRLGIRGEGTVQIVDGLAAGDEVIAQDRPVEPGQRVRRG